MASQYLWLSRETNAASIYLRDGISVPSLLTEKTRSVYPSNKTWRSAHWQVKKLINSADGNIKRRHFHSRIITILASQCNENLHMPITKFIRTTTSRELNRVVVDISRKTLFSIFWVTYPLAADHGDGFLPSCLRRVQSTDHEYTKGEQRYATVFRTLNWM